MFLDIACFFKWECKDVVVRILDGCNSFPTCGMKVLQNRFLVGIIDNVVQMHDLIQQNRLYNFREECPRGQTNGLVKNVLESNENGIDCGM